MTLGRACHVRRLKFKRLISLENVFVEALGMVIAGVGTVIGYVGQPVTSNSTASVKITTCQSNTSFESIKNSHETTTSIY